MTVVDDEALRRLLLGHVLVSGRIAAWAPFAASVIAKHDLAALVVHDDALKRFVRDLELSVALVLGCLGREHTPLGVVTLALVPRALIEARMGELNRAIAPEVPFGHVRVVVIAGVGFTFGSIAIAPTTTGVLA